MSERIDILFNCNDHSLEFCLNTGCDIHYLAVWLDEKINTLASQINFKSHPSTIMTSIVADIIRLSFNDRYLSSYPLLPVGKPTALQVFSLDYIVDVNLSEQKISVDVYKVNGYVEKYMEDR